MNKKTSIIAWHRTILPSLSLFTSIGTLLCCALPALLVTLGMGAALAGIIGAIPWIAVVSDYKATIFIGAGLLLAIACGMQFYTRNAPCPTDPLKAKACGRLRAIGWILSGISVTIYCIGFFFAFMAADLFY